MPTLLAQIQGAAQILNQERLAALADATRRRIQEIQSGALAVDGTVLDGIAVCVGTIGAFLDGLRAGRRNLDALIDSALREMDAAIEGKTRAVVSAPRPATADIAPIVDELRAAMESWLANHGDDHARARGASTA